MGEPIHSSAEIDALLNSEDPIIIKIGSAMQRTNDKLSLLDDKITAIGKKADQTDALARSIQDLVHRMDSVDEKLGEVLESKKFKVQSAINVILGIIQGVGITVLLWMMGMK